MTSETLVPRLIHRFLARVSYLFVALLAVPAILVFSAPAAKAEFIALSGVAFVKRCPCPIGVEGDGSEEVGGVLRTIDNQSRFFADVVFPTSGERVCALRLVYRDFNAADTLIARLWKKPVVIGGSAFSGLVLMAQVSTAAGAVNTVRLASTTTISSPIINNFNAFYYVELVSPTFNLDILGVQIDVRPTCA